MYKLLLVDDRIDVIETIEMVVDWTSLEIEVVGKAINGVEALEIVKTHNPDIIITDIKMPNMDGLELTKKVRDIGGEVEIVILSGYDEFNYAKQAMQLGVKDYLLKPVKIDKIMELVMKIKKELDEKRQEQNHYTKLKKRAIESTPLLQIEYLNKIIKNPVLDKVKMKTKLDDLGIKLDVEGFRVIILSWDDIDKEDSLASYMGFELITFSAINIMEETVGQEFKKVIFKNNNQIVGIINNLYSDKQVIEIANDWKRNINRCLKHSVTIGIGGYYDEPMDIITSYEEAKTATESNFIIGKNNVIHVKDLNENHTINFKYPTQKLNNLFQYIKIGIIEKTSEAYQVFIKEFYDNNTISPKEIKRYLIGSITVLYNEVKGEGIDLDNIFGNQINILNVLENAKTLADLDVELKNTLMEIVHYIDQLNTENKGQQIKDIIKYIETNYADPNISLNEISRRFFTSTSYLSVMLKESLGETFSEHIRKLRMEKAKLMLMMDNNKVYEIAQNVGYTDRRHFSDVFKKYTGMTPKQYTEKYKNKYNV